MAVEAGANTSGHGTGVVDEDVNLSIMAKGPVAAFSARPTSGPRPLTVTFTDSSKGSITSRVWEYKLHPESAWVVLPLSGSALFTFTSAGIYDVRLDSHRKGWFQHEDRTGLYNRD